MKLVNKTVSLLAVACLTAVAAVNAPTLAQEITLRGAAQFGDDHAYNKTLLKFEELIKEFYGKPIKFILHRNGELGVEKDYFGYMSLGTSVDYAIVAPSHMSTFSKMAPIMDMPFLFRDLSHWDKVLDSEAFKPIADDVASKADVMLVGYAGGGVRNLIVNKPVRNMDELKSLQLRVMGAPIQSRMFSALTLAPTVINYQEVYNAIQTGVIEALENESASLQSMKFYEVAPNIVQTQHAITVRPICFSGKTFRKLPKDLQAAILKAGKKAGAYGRKIESAEDQSKLEQMQKEGKIKIIAFKNRAKLLELAKPVKESYAKELSAEQVLNAVSAIQ